MQVVFSVEVILLEQILVDGMCVCIITVGVVIYVACVVNKCPRSIACCSSWFSCRWHAVQMLSDRKQKWHAQR